MATLVERRPLTWILPLSGAIVGFLIWLIYLKTTRAPAPSWVGVLPAANAFFNSCSAGALAGGYISIKRGNREAHMRFMLSAVVFSALFLVSYIVYHGFHGDTRFPGQGIIRPIYFFILISHIGLSIVALPMILSTLFYAATGRFGSHRAIARFTLPVWFYVSVTGVVVFALLRAYVSNIPGSDAMTTSYEQITYETRGPVALITLNRPDKLNAWTPPMGMEQADAIARANADPTIGAIVMTGAGRGFCAGADMEATFKSRIDGTDPGGNTAGGQGGMPAGLDWVAMARASKPLIAAVNGAAVGIGMTMVLPFDVIVASEKSKFGMLFIKVGLVPELASTHFLVQRMGFGRASEMCLSGRLYSGAEAYQAGLVDVLTTPEDLLPKAFAIAEGIAANPDPQLRMTKQLLTANGSATDLVAVQERESVLLRECWKSPEHKEAVSAFLEKRPPRFRD